MHIQVATSNEESFIMLTFTDSYASFHDPFGALCTKCLAIECVLQAHVAS